MLFTLLLAWLGASCVTTILAVRYYPDRLARSAALLGLKDARSQRALITIGYPLAMLLAIPLGYANYLNYIGNLRAAVVCVLLAATVLTGFLAVLFFGSWSLGWRCFSLGVVSVTLAISAPMFVLAAIFQAREQEELAQLCWVPATAASLGALALRAIVVAKESRWLRLKAKKAEHKTRRKLKLSARRRNRKR